MKTTKTITKKHPKGEMIFEITVEKKIVKNEISLDGHVFEAKPELIKNQEITVTLAGKRIGSYSSITKNGTYPEIEKRYSEQTQKAYGYLSPEFGLSEQTYNEIKTALDACIAETTTEEIAKQEKIEAEKAAETKRKDDENQKEYESAIRDGLCPKCHTYCHGDCKAN